MWRSSDPLGAGTGSPTAPPAGVSGVASRRPRGSVRDHVVVGLPTQSRSRGAGFARIANGPGEPSPGPFVVAVLTIALAGGRSWRSIVAVNRTGPTSPPRRPTR